ncbi:MAG TPA: M20/M25/M40 family metallo-hydrolase, partial [Thermoanaerobaculia bacterium]|nr:M20/M25/M40 family metallo-hydrolase [Thermoanaerobaculia bacterium]
CTITVDARTIAAFDNERMISAVRASVRSEVEIVSRRLNPVSGDPNSRIARAALAAAPGRAVGGFGGVSDLAHLAGRPAIVFGPGTPDQSHAADESIALEALTEAPAIYRAAIENYFA